MTATVATSFEEKLLTVAEYLELERHSDVRHEFYYGKLLPMPGESKNANRIAKSILKKMDDALLERGLEFFSHDVKAEVVPGGIYRYPDLVVAPVVDEADDYIVKLPVMLVEIASSDSNKRDRVRKRNEYFKIPTLWYYLVVDQDTMLVELHTRGDDDQFSLQAFTEPSEVLDFQRFGLTLTLAEVYQYVKVES